MKRIKQAQGAVLIVAAMALAACGGGSDDDNNNDTGGGSPGPMASNDPPDQPATETNAAPAPCAHDGECPSGVACVFLEPGQPGFCDVDEMIAPGEAGSGDPGAGMPVSSATPAPCTTDQDCGPEIRCKRLEAGAGPGFCDVDEMIAPDAGGAGQGGT